MKEANFYEIYDKDKKIVKCNLCPQYCYIQEGMEGTCAVRKNIDGKLYSLVYGKMKGAQIDPIEKKPLFHFYPESDIFSFCTVGCNMKCLFCQNFTTSQVSKGVEGIISGENVSPKEIVEIAKKHGCKSIAMTYNEPTIFFEYAYDTCVEAKKEGLKTVFVSNGYITKKAIDKIAPVLDAINIDLKGFTNKYYQKICGAQLQPVLDAIKYYYEKGVFMEITTLIIPGENDSDDELKQIAEFIASISKDIPWHISRFHPDYKMLNKNLTPINTLSKAYDIGGKAKLKYIYVGNVQGNKFENTICPKCNETLIKRQGYHIFDINIINNKCKFCNTKINGIWH